MKPGAGKYFFAAAALPVFLAAADARAQLESLPLGYVTNFSSVTYFEPPHEQQVKARLSGAEETPLPGGLLGVKQLQIESFNVAGKLEMVVRAPQCTYALLDHVASSPGHLELQTGDGKFHTEGEGFLWRQNESLLIISNNVHTVIKSGILNLSAP